MLYLRRLQHFLWHNSSGTLGGCKSSFHGHDQPVNAPGRLSLCIFLQDIWIPHWLGGVANQKLKVAMKPPLITVHICCHESNTLEAGPSAHTRALTDLHSPVSVCTSDLKTGRCPSLASLPSRSVGSFWGPSGPSLVPFCTEVLFLRFSMLFSPTPSLLALQSAVYFVFLFSNSGSGFLLSSMALMQLMPSVGWLPLGPMQWTWRDGLS